MAFSSFVSYLQRKPSWTSGLTKLARRRGTVSAAASVCVVDSLAEALRRGYVRQFGRQTCLDPNGFLLPTETAAIPLKYVDILADVAAEVRAVLIRRKVQAIFVRGSIVTGNLLPAFRSDLDLVVFTKDRVRREEKVFLRDVLLSQVRKTLLVGSLDIRYLHKEKQRGERQQFRFSHTLRIILRYFAVPIYGSRVNVGISDVPLQPKPHLAIDIRNDIDSFRRTIQTGLTEDCFSLQLLAIQWLCKRCLRATAELSALKTRAYSRDLLPCYQLGVEAYPDFADTMLHALLIACASPENRYLDMQKGDILHKGANIAFQFAEIVEELSIRQSFGSRSAACKELPDPVSSDAFRPIWRLLDPFENLKERLFAGLLLFSRRIPVDNIDFRTWPLPALQVKGHKFVKIEVLNTEEFNVFASFDDRLVNVSEPVVYRDHRHSQCDDAEVTSDVLRSLLRSVPTVQCRVARGHNVTFCRSSHRWIEDQIFTPPSVLLSLPVHEAIQRLRGCQGLPNLVYDDYEDECVYIQTRAIPHLRVFENCSLAGKNIVQEERLWVSSQGTVSALHYDASYSALYMRCGQKRLLFFPPCCLSQLGIYPLGHPLHRRGRVDLTSKDTVIFQEFWKDCALKAMEVTLRPGDLLLFPPFWSHYTETMTTCANELSISHTLRYDTV